ncbi:hypothetical protein MMC12_006857 [Toensbergia leucococca]|nr:hypothetical protein [Toensbergia leucococca]
MKMTLCSFMLSLFVFTLSFLHVNCTSCIEAPITSLVSDGNPHFNGLQKQVSELLSCGTEGCQVTQLTSYTIGWSISIGTKFDFIDIGGDVEKSWTTGDSYTCNGGPGDTICVWVNLQHTAYTVWTDWCYTDPNPYVVKAPHKDNWGGKYYCVVGTCRNNGDEYWNDN